MNTTSIREMIISGALEKGSALSFEHRRAISNMQTCRTLERGGRIMFCRKCKTGIVLYNPCNQRGCPECYKKNQMMWMSKVQEKLLPISHEHISFTFPQIITQLWLRHKSEIVNTLFQCVDFSIKELIKETGILFGSILVFQSHGKSMCYKPHIHCILTSGGLNSSKVWQGMGSIQFSHLEASVKKHFFEILSKNIEVNDIHGMAKGIKENDWRVFPTHHKDSAEEIVSYLSRSIAGVVIDLDQEFTINDDAQTIAYNEYHLGQMRKTQLKKSEFIDRYLNHIPPTGCVTVRYYGLYSNSYALELEVVRKEISGKEKQIVQVADECPECQTILEYMMHFHPGELPRVISIAIRAGRAPPMHGAVLYTA